MKKIFALAALFVTIQTFSQDRIFGTDRSITYAIRYLTQSISVTDTVKITVSDKPWHRQPDKQFEMIINYQNSNTDTSVFRNLPSIGWVDADTTGAVDNEELCWFHPPRHNQFTSLEMAPFPRVEFPL